MCCPFPLTLHTMRSERNHAAERGDLEGSGPGKTFIHHSHRHMLGECYQQHLRLGGRGPVNPKPCALKVVARGEHLVLWEA